MPAKNCLKEYSENSYYHVYNRGVAKQEIFIDDQDYKVFLSYLKFYLTIYDLGRLSSKVDKVPPSQQLKNYFGKLKLLAYCLIPNHFHLFIYQKDFDSMSKFMKSLGTRYSKYLNRKYHRVGPVFQSRYKAVLIEREYQFVYLSKYIHRNPLSILGPKSYLEAYKYSSYGVYLGKFNQSWVDKSDILSYFSKSNIKNSYQEFVEEIDERDLPLIKKIALDGDW